MDNFIKRKKPRDPYSAGYMAYKEGCKVCPYTDFKRRDEWMNGYIDARLSYTDTDTFEDQEE